MCVYGRLRPLPSCWVIRMSGLVHQLDSLYVAGGGPQHSHHSGWSACRGWVTRSMACAWMVQLPLPSGWVTRTSGLGDPLPGLPPNPPPQVTSSDHRPPPYLVPPGAQPRPPCVHGAAARPSQATPRPIHPHTAPAIPGIPAHNHCGVDPGTARAKRKEGTPIKQPILLGGIALPIMCHSKRTRRVRRDPGCGV